MGRTARERLARLLDEAEAPGSFSAQILAPADALQVEVGVGDHRRERGYRADHGRRGEPDHPVPAHRLAPP